MKSRRILTSTVVAAALWGLVALPLSAASVANKGGHRLCDLQADITEDNAGNGLSDNDPDDGGWDWYLDPSARGDTLAVDTARGILEAVPEQSVVMTDWGVAAVLRLLQRREGLRPDVQVLYDDRDRPARLRTEARPVYLAHIPFYPPQLRAEGFRLEGVREGLPLFRIRPEEDAR